MPTIENYVDRQSEIRCNTRLEHVATCPKIKGGIYEIDVFMDGKENNLGRATHFP